MKAKNNNIGLPGNSGIKSIPYHTVIAKKKGPHPIGTVLRRRGDKVADLRIHVDLNGL